MTYPSILCHPDDLTEVGISSGWVTAMLLCHPDEIRFLFLSHPDGVANFDFPQNAVALQRFRSQGGTLPCRPAPCPLPLALSVGIPGSLPSTTGGTWDRWMWCHNPPRRKWNPAPEFPFYSKLKETQRLDLVSDLNFPFMQSSKFAIV